MVAPILQVDLLKTKQAVVLPPIDAALDDESQNLKVVVAPHDDVPNFESGKLRYARYRVPQTNNNTYFVNQQSIDKFETDKGNAVKSKISIIKSSIEKFKFPGHARQTSNNTSVFSESTLKTLDSAEGQITLDNIPKRSKYSLNVLRKKLLRNNRLAQ
jgi:hypothetical protein